MSFLFRHDPQCIFSFHEIFFVQAMYTFFIHSQYEELRQERTNERKKKINTNPYFSLLYYTLALHSLALCAQRTSIQFDTFIIWFKQTRMTTNNNRTIFNRNVFLLFSMKCACERMNRNMRAHTHTRCFLWFCARHSMIESRFSVFRNCVTESKRARLRKRNCLFEMFGSTVIRLVMCARIFHCHCDSVSYNKCRCRHSFFLLYIFFCVREPEWAE